MFSRSPANGAKPSQPDVRAFESVKSPGSADTRYQPHGSGGPSSPSRASGESGFSLGSIIGNDLTIVGQGLRIITQGTLQVDGKVEGDVLGKEVIVGDKGAVTGVVSGENVVIRGAVHGTIRAFKVALQSSARVEGDIHHQQLTVEEGAHLDGRVRRPQDPAELRPNLDPMQPSDRDA